MKSKTFFSEVQKQEFLRQLWLMALFAILFFLVFPIRWLMQLDNLTYGVVYSRQELQNLFVNQNVSSVVITISVIFAGTLGAVYHFAYLHSGKQMDFFGSFPIRREKLFLHKAVFGYIDFVIPYTVTWGIVLVLGITKNLVTGKALLAVLAAWAVDQIYYLLVYLTAALAMILTGRLVLGIVGSGVLLFFGMFVSRIYSACMTGFFDTCVPDYEEDKLAFLSPIYYGNTLKNHIQEIYLGMRKVTGKETILVLVGLAAVISLLFLNRWLIRKRAGEVAGRSMAFVIPARVIHVVLSVSSGLWLGLIIRDMMYNRRTFWVLISVFFGTVFFYIFIQFIYTMDFRKVLRYKWQLLAAELLSMGIICVFCFDLVGYDSYMPNLEKTENISLSIQNYYMDGTYQIDGEYVEPEEYRLRNMRIGQLDMVYKMIKELIAEQDDSENDAYQHLTIRYTLKSGRSIDRCYRIDYREYEQELSRLLDDRSFRETTYPCLGELGEETTGVWLEYADGNHQILSKDDVTVEEFLEIYREEMRALPGSAIIEEIPLASLRMQTDSGNSFYMYLYPSCEKSLAYLKRLGWQVEPLLTAERVKEITIEDYRSYDDESDDGDSYVEQENVIEETKEKITIYTELEEIEQILPVLQISDYTEVWNERRDNMYANVTVETPSGYSASLHCELKAGELPEILEER